MTDIHGTTYSPTRDSNLRSSGITGEASLHTVDLVTREKTALVLQPPHDWVFDMPSREIGVAKITEDTFDVRTAPVGSANPVPSTDDAEYKAAYRIHVWYWEHGRAVIITNAAIFMAALVKLVEQYKAFPEAAQGLLPVVRFGHAIAVKRGTKSFFAPHLSIVSWVARDAVAAFRSRPATVHQLSLPMKSHGGVALPARDAKQIINDEIPFSPCWQ